MPRKGSVYNLRGQNDRMRPHGDGRRGSMVRADTLHRLASSVEWRDEEHLTQSGRRRGTPRIREDEAIYDESDKMAGKQSALISDIDGTLLGDDEALQVLVDRIASLRPHLRVAYATGRMYPSVREALTESALPQPDAVICAVGTEIHRYPSGQVVQEWHDRLGRDWSAERVRQLLGGQPDVELQPDDCQSDLKASFYWRDVPPQRLDDVRMRLREAGLRAEIIYSSNRDLDVLPAGANKGTAAAFLASVWGIPPERVMVSGDSGNDRALFEQGFRGIVVANAHAELKELAGPHVYQARRPFAGGILEGLEHWLSKDPTP
jgi:sucrose-6F-phosphate phosphohydrolase